MSRKSNFMDLATVGNYAVSNLTSGVVAGVGSYFLLKREGNVQVFGINMKHALYDGLLLVASATIGNIVRVWLGPMVESKFISSPKMMDFINNILGPAITGGAFVGFNMIAEVSNEDMKNFGLAAVSNFIGNGINSVWKPNVGYGK